MAFTKAVEAAGLRHQTIPPKAHTWQSDVETAHRLIEDEFYEVEKFGSESDFLRKSAAYLVWFNAAKKNSYRDVKHRWR